MPARSPPQPELPVQLPAGFDSELERLAQADAAASEETFSNSEPEGDSEPESESGVLIPPNEPENDDSGSDGQAPLTPGPPAKAAEFTFQNLSAAEEWKFAEARLISNK